MPQEMRNELASQILLDVMAQIEFHGRIAWASSMLQNNPAKMQHGTVAARYISLMPSRKSHRVIKTRHEIIGKPRF
jgi:hypothetical protein